MALKKGTAIARTGSRALVPARELAEAAREFVKSADADNTIRAYESQWRLFEEWCRLRGVQALPADPKTLAAYLTERALQGAKVSTLEQALAAIARKHLDHDFSPPQASRQVRLVWRGIRRKIGAGKRQASPLTPDALRRMIRACRSRYDLVCVRNAALLLVGFSAALRRSEIVALLVEHLVFEEEGLRIFIASSKTDQEKIGQWVGIVRGSDPKTCPVRALQAWLDASGIKEGIVFRGLRNGKLTKDALTGGDVARIVKEMALQAGLKVDRLSGHSLRSGLGTTAAKQKKSLAQIQKHMRHKGVEQTLGYIRDAELLDDDNVTSGIGL